MRWTLAAAMLVAGLFQGRDVVDFLQVMTGYTKDQADSALTQAFAKEGFEIILSTPDQIEAQEQRGSAFGGGKIFRAARAFITVGDSTGIHLTAEEVTHDRAGWITKRKKITSKDSGENGRFWQKLTAMVAGMDSAAHPRR